MVEDKDKSVDEELSSILDDDDDDDEIAAEPSPEEVPEEEKSKPGQSEPEPEPAPAEPEEKPAFDTAGIDCRKCAFYPFLSLKPTTKHSEELKAATKHFTRSFCGTAPADGINCRGKQFKPIA